MSTNLTTNEVNVKLEEFYNQLSLFQRRKNTAYDNAWNKRGRLVAGGNPIDGLKYRLEEKLERLEAQFQRPETQMDSESLLDTIKDAIGYLALLHLCLENKKAERPKDAPPNSSFDKTPCSGAVRFVPPLTGKPVGVDPQTGRVLAFVNEKATAP